MDSDDADWYRQEVGEEPDPGKSRGFCCVQGSSKARLPAAVREMSPRSSPGRNKDRTRESGGNRA